jgi:peptidase E
MSSTGANRETEGGTMKNVIDNPETQPQSHKYAENESHSNTEQGHTTTGNNNQSHSNSNQGHTTTDSTGANQESPGGTMKNVIDNPATKPQSSSNTGTGNK